MVQGMTEEQCQSIEEECSEYKFVFTNPSQEIALTPEDVPFLLAQFSDGQFSFHPKDYEESARPAVAKSPAVKKKSSSLFGKKKKDKGSKVFKANEMDRIRKGM
tara:strand:- start:472 stop:783 length:312 start_codon:yes stop_codon:yes gene_type:complete